MLYILEFSPADHVDHIGKFVGFAVNTVFKPGKYMFQKLKYSILENYLQKI